MIFKGAFLRDHYDEMSDDYMYFYISMVLEGGRVRNVSEIYRIPVAPTSELDNVKENRRSKTIYLDQPDYQSIHQNASLLSLNLWTNVKTSFPVNFSYDPSPLDKDLGLILAAIVLVGLYVLIIWELVHRTFAAWIASTMAIGKKLVCNVFLLILFYFVYKQFWRQ